MNGGAYTVCHGNINNGGGKMQEEQFNCVTERVGTYKYKRKRIIEKR